MSNRDIIFVACNADYATRFGRMDITVNRLIELYGQIPKDSTTSRD